MNKALSKGSLRIPTKRQALVLESRSGHQKTFRQYDNSPNRQWIQPKGATPGDPQLTNSLANELSVNPPKGL